MKKKLLSLVLALALSLSLAVPALAAEGQIEAPQTVTFTNMTAQEEPVMDAGGWWVKRITCSGGAAFSLKGTYVNSETQEESPLDHATVYKVDSIDVFFSDPHLCAEIVYDEAGQKFEDMQGSYPLEDGEWLIEVKTKDSPMPAETIYVKVGGSSPSAPAAPDAPAPAPAPAAADEPVPAPAASGFTDVKSDAYYVDAVTWAVEQGITNGITDTTFGPDRTCTRAQIIAFLWRAAGSPEPENVSAFPDVKTDAYYAKAAAWAKENGMADGDSFSPDAPCTRLMAVEFMWKHAGSPDAATAGFSDVTSPAVNWAVEQCVTVGSTETTFSPDNTCTRGQIVAFLWRAFAD